MKVIYDGSFEGLLSLVYDQYKEIEKIDIERDCGQLNLFENKFIKTDLDKYDRVRESIIEKFGRKFFSDLYLAFKSDDENKDTSIANIIKCSYKYGITYLNSSEKHAILFRRILKNVEKENHTFKGITRFVEIKEGYLFAKINPHNDILEFLSLHFIKRMPNEKFVIFDENRKKAMVYLEGQSQIVDIIDLKIEESKDEKIFKDAWRKFYDSILIKQRINKKLMVSNMPKKYWKNLPEKNRNL